ncbi:MAG: formylglycine-generating enzyme family protein [Leptospiraceae bacterium]|nr:formylglycine-generating enzyme family protein [Leptospiraceae bacterium]
MKASYIHYLLLNLLLIQSNNLLASPMIKVPAGWHRPFLKESLNKSSVPVAVQSFYLDTRPVNRADFLLFLKEHPEWNRARASRLYVDDNYLYKWSLNKNTEEELKKSPANFVSWFAAKAYCESQNKRLPTEIEWEYAASFPAKGSSIRDLQKLILDWYAAPRQDSMPHMGQFVNRLGLEDMHGLMWEWVYDFNTASVTGDSRQDPDIENSLFCGAGSLSSNDFSNYAAYMRYGFRTGLKGWYSSKYLGFRCAANRP